MQPHLGEPEPTLTGHTAELQRAAPAAFLSQLLGHAFGRGAGAPIEIPSALDGEIEWRELRVHEWLFDAGGPGDSMYVLVSGRLEAVVTDARGRETVVGQVGPGESVGEMALLTGEPRSAGVRATRDSVLIRISSSAFRALSRSDPALLGSLLRVLARRLQRQYDRRARRTGSCTIALVPVAAHLLDTRLAHRLAQHLTSCGRVALADTSSLLAPPAHGGVGDDGSAAAAERLVRLERDHDVVLLDCPYGDARAADWAVRHADKIVLCANAGDAPDPGPHERAALAGVRPASMDITLLLVHRRGAPPPRNTRRWLRRRELRGHLHVRATDDRDFARVARILAGKALAVVMGGAGARGNAYIGVLRVLEELGVTFDIACGTSVGGLIAVGPAMDLPVAEIYERAKRINAENPFADFTVPLLSLLRGDKLARLIEDAVGPGGIEDLWKPFFCVSASLTRSEAHVHRRGRLWRAVRASMGLPGVMPPVIDGGELLVDGGIVNNFPVDIVRREFGCRTVGIMASPAGEGTVPARAYPSAWRYLYDRFLRRAPGWRVPTLPEVLAQTTMLASHRKQHEDVELVDLLLQPPVGSFSMVDVGRYDELVRVGEQYAREESERIQAALVAPAQAAR